jgi:hypothetical protein
MRTLLLALATFACACGGDDGATPLDAPPGPEPLSPAAPDGGQQLATDKVTLQPGEEKYMCFQFYSPEDAVGITRVEAISMAGVHHIGLFQAFGRDEDPKPHECDTLIKQTWLPIWASGAGSPKLELPAGTAFVIQPGTQYIVQLHLQNASEAPIDVRAGLNLTYDRAIDALQPAGMYAFGTFDMEVPANTLDYEVPVTDCVPGKDMHVFAAFPHMHKYGTKLELTRSVDGGAAETFYKIDPWVFGDQPMDPLDVTVSPTDTFALTCHYANPTNEPVPYGESSDTEMCFFVLFYYPYDALSGCIIGG